MKATGNLLGTILDLGWEMMVTGAEVWRVEDMLEKMIQLVQGRAGRCLHIEHKSYILQRASYSKQ